MNPSMRIDITPTDPNYFIPNRFHGKTLLVTGAATGIVSAAAIRAVWEGANIVGFDRKEKELNATVSQIKSEGHQAIAVVGNVVDTEACDRAVASAVRVFGGLDLALNAIAVLDLASATITSIQLLGLKDFSQGLPTLTTYEFTNLPVLGTTATVNPTNPSQTVPGQDIQLGGFSRLYFEGVAANDNLKFITHTDRGPNAEPTGNNCPFSLPNFQPRLIRFELNQATGALTITEQIGLTRADGTPLTGLPNLQRGTVGTQTYYITANEGDGRDYPGFSDEIRVGNASYVLDPTVFPNAASLKNDANLGRLTVSRVTGDTDGDGDIDHIQAFGGRSFSTPIPINPSLCNT